MKFYNGLIKFDGSGKIEDIVMINDSFSFSCLFFAPAWLLFHKMWKEFFGLVICIIIIELAFNSLIQDTFLLILAFLILVANNCKSWYSEYLISKKNYHMVAVILAKNKLDAQNKLINQISKFGKTKAEFFFSQEIFPQNIAFPSLFTLFRFNQKN